MTPNFHHDIKGAQIQDLESKANGLSWPMIIIRFGGGLPLNTHTHTHTQVEAHGIKSACPSVSLYVVANPVQESVMCQSRDGVAASRWAHKHRGEVGRTITMVLVAPGANSGHHFHLVLVIPAAPSPLPPTTIIPIMNTDTVQTRVTFTKKASSFLREKSQRNSLNGCCLNGMLLQTLINVALRNIAWY